MNRDPGQPAAPAFDSWTLSADGLDREEWAGTLFALSNGTLGVRGIIDVLPHASGAAFLTEAYETSSIHYHERLSGFATTTDTRVPVADGLAMELSVDGELPGAAADLRRMLDLQRGLFRYELSWRTRGGTSVKVVGERLVPLSGEAVVAGRLSIVTDRPAAVRLTSRLQAATGPEAQGDDPRIGANLNGGGIDIINANVTSDGAEVVQRLRLSGLRVAAAQRHRSEGAVTSSREDAAESFEFQAAPGEAIVIEKLVAYATAATGDPDPREAARTLADKFGGLGFEALAAEQQATLRAFWATAEAVTTGDARSEQALRVNLFHLFQAASRTGKGSVAAKGLTGEGYEGHYFWDTEAFVLPVIALTAPQLARRMLEYRFATLDAAQQNARALNHKKGALFAWRTIAGRECSAHYPSGAAQYHINAAVAYAVGLYVAATDDEAFLVEMGAEMLCETARIWLDIGQFKPRRNGSFCIYGVTGPDEYTALVDNNWYTNRMAQKHLRLAAEVAERVAAGSPDAWSALSARIDLDAQEIASWRRAANAMYLGYDSELGVDAQDDSFLDKPRWDIAGTPPEQFPLLLHHHPLTLYRHQVSKQADLILGLVLGGEEIDPDRKRRDFDYYSGVTVHDSTLSASSFSILASEVGAADDAWRYFQDTLFVDLEDRHGNADHGAHMAALAGSWLAFAWGFGGLRIVGDLPHFAPTLPGQWPSYGFGIVWRGARLRVEVGATGVLYAAQLAPVTFVHRGERITLQPGESRAVPAAGRTA